VALTRKEIKATAFRPLLNKVKASMKKRKGADEVYRPGWFAFEAMAKFLDGVYQPRSTMNTKCMLDSYKLILHNNYQYKIALTIH
jgi:hypothetical protein